MSHNHMFHLKPYVTEARCPGFGARFAWSPERGTSSCLHDPGELYAINPLAGMTVTPFVVVVRPSS